MTDEDRLSNIPLISLVRIVSRRCVASFKAQLRKVVLWITPAAHRRYSFLIDALATIWRLQAVLYAVRLERKLVHAARCTEKTRRWSLCANRLGNGNRVVFYAEVDRMKWSVREIGIEN